MPDTENTPSPARAWGAASKAKPFPGEGSLLNRVGTSVFPAASIGKSRTPFEEIQPSQCNVQAGTPPSVAREKALKKGERTFLEFKERRQRHRLQQCTLQHSPAAPAPLETPHAIGSAQPLTPVTDRSSCSATTTAHMPAGTPSCLFQAPASRKNHQILQSRTCNGSTVRSDVVRHMCMDVLTTAIDEVTRLIDARSEQSLATPGSSPGEGEARIVACPLFDPLGPGDGSGRSPDSPEQGSPSSSPTDGSCTSAEALRHMTYTRCALFAEEAAVDGTGLVAEAGDLKAGHGEAMQAAPIPNPSPACNPGANQATVPTPSADCISVADQAIPVPCLPSNPSLCIPHRKRGQQLAFHAPNHVNHDTEAHNHAATTAHTMSRLAALKGKLRGAETPQPLSPSEGRAPLPVSGPSSERPSLPALHHEGVTQCKNEVSLVTRRSLLKSFGCSASLTKEGPSDLLRSSTSSPLCSSQPQQCPAIGLNPAQLGGVSSEMLRHSTGIPLCSLQPHQRQSMGLNPGHLDVGAACDVSSASWQGPGALSPCRQGPNQAQKTPLNSNSAPGSGSLAFQGPGPARVPRLVSIPESTSGPSAWVAMDCDTAPAMDLLMENQSMRAEREELKHELRLISQRLAAIEERTKAWPQGPPRAKGRSRSVGPRPGPGAQQRPQMAASRAACMAPNSGAPPAGTPGSASTGGPGDKGANDVRGGGRRGRSTSRSRPSAASHRPASVDSRASGSLPHPSLPAHLQKTRIPVPQLGSSGCASRVGPDARPRLSLAAAGPLARAQALLEQIGQVGGGTLIGGVDPLKSLLPRPPALEGAAVRPGGNNNTTRQPGASCSPRRSRSRGWRRDENIEPGREQGPGCSVEPTRLRGLQAAGPNPGPPGAGRQPAAGDAGAASKWVPPTLPPPPPVVRQPLGPARNPPCLAHPNSAPRAPAMPGPPAKPFPAATAPAALHGVCSSGGEASTVVAPEKRDLAEGPSTLPPLVKAGPADAALQGHAPHNPGVFPNSDPQQAVRNPSTGPQRPAGDPSTGAAGPEGAGNVARRALGERSAVVQWWLAGAPSPQGPRTFTPRGSGR